LWAVHRTIEEVRARDLDYFEQHALRTTLVDAPLLTVPGAAAAVLASSHAPPGRCRITVPAGASRPGIGELIGDAYGVELILGADPSALSAVDRLFESRLGGAARGWPAVAGGRAGDHESSRCAGAAGVPELADAVSAWRNHQLALQRSERARLADFPAASTLRVPARRGTPAYRLFGDAGPLLVIVNAVAQGLHYWSRLIDRLARDHRLAVWELRSAVEDGRLTTQDDHVGDLEAIVDDAAEGQVHLVGWCTGPKACAQYYLAHPERVASMVFLAGTYRPFGDRAFETPYERTLEQVFDFLARSPSAASAVRATLVDAIGVGRPTPDRGSDAGVDVLGRIDPPSRPTPRLSRPAPTQGSSATSGTAHSSRTRAPCTFRSSWSAPSSTASPRRSWGRGSRTPCRWGASWSCPAPRTTACTTVRTTSQRSSVASSARRGS